MSASLAATSQPQNSHNASVAASSASAVIIPNQGLDRAQLLNGQKAVTIVHNGTPYRLQATKLGKLILTK